jgi:hypothetical protein
MLLIPEEARAGGSGATSGNDGGSKNGATKAKNSVRLVFEFKNFWSVLVEETKKPAKNSTGFEESSIWWGLRTFARTLFP